MKAFTPSTQSPSSTLGGRPQRRLEESHERMRQILVRVNAIICANGNSEQLIRKLVLDVNSDIVSALANAKWATSLEASR